ncbi:peptide-methionine (S)-S-oxide reductase MsrA [Paraburkholderia silvatlantica]|uniref:peptide-methionine (S)-S-oxide reductase MsrA n=1 Tax=Paraburkholderia silvatlantica TaxID=321895 RepID=UPI0037502BFC
MKFIDSIRGQAVKVAARELHRLVSRRTARTAFALAVLTVVGVGLQHAYASSDVARAVPGPVVDETGAGTETAVLAGGCFWGVQGVFQHVKGVKSAVSGYAGGNRSTAEYEVVSTGTTGHAESVQITFDPHQVSYGKILQIYFSVVTDPTTLNRQGPDTGTQYRSTIFAANAAQARVAKAYIAQLDAAHVYPDAIVTTIEMNRPFYPAEGYHQNYLTLHPDQPYIAINDIPKVENLKRFFPQLYQPQPVLVKSGAKSDTL